VLFPGIEGDRYGQFDEPLIEQALKERCPDCPAEFVHARGDAAIQRQQVHSMITKQIDVLILDIADAKALRSSVNDAHRAGIPVVAYDRLAEGPISGFVTFDGAQVGRLQGEALLEAMGDKARGGQIVMLNGHTADPNAGWFKQGALSVLEGKVKIGKSYDTLEWRTENAHANMSAAIAALGADNIDGVLSANDNMASGAISALKAAGVRPLPPVTGQDADLVAVRRIVTGEQYMSVYKPFKPEADAAAAMAVALGRGEKLDDIANTRFDNGTTKDIPTRLLSSVSVTVKNIKDTVVKDGMYTIDQICTPQLRVDCDKAGLT
jgi:D-xylose transport system substrate-binding protein